jgi:hypothetical protein
MAISIFRGTAEQKVNSYSLGLQQEAKIARLDDGGWVITWSSSGQDGSKTGVYQQRYDAHGTAVGGETQVNTYTTSHQENPDITVLADGGWLVSWTSYDQDGDFSGVYQQRYAANGSPIGNEVRVNTYTSGSQSQPSVSSLKDGGWLVSWASYGQDGSSMGIYQQRYNASGTPVGGEIRVNTITALAQTDPSVTALADGGWVVTWETEEPNNPYPIYDIHHQRYNAQGVKVDGERIVNSTFAKSQTDATVTALADGGWVVVWTSDNQNQSGYSTSIYQQRYNALGERQGGEIRVDNSSGYGASNPTVTALSDGGWIVTFKASDGDGTAYNGIYQQRYSSEGNALFSLTPSSTRRLREHKSSRASCSSRTAAGS